MRLIIIESDIYRVTEKQYEHIREVQDRLFKNYHPDSEIEMSDFLEGEKKNYKHLGPVDYDFRL